MTDITKVRDSSDAIINPAKEDGNLATIKDDLALMKADIDTIRLKQNQLQQDTHWQILMTDSGEIQAEATGKIVIITDIVGMDGTANLQANIRKKDASGTILLYLRALQNTPFIASFREGLEGDSHDGAGAGSFYFVKEAGTPGVTITGYMRDE